MARPRNPDRTITNANIPAEVYNRFRDSVPAGMTVQAALTRVVRFYLALPADAREVLLSRLSPASKILVLKAVIRQLQQHR